MERHKSHPSHFPVADGGLVYLVNPNAQLDAELYVGLGAPVRSLAAGLSFRL